MSTTKQKYDFRNGDQGYWTNTFREFRHSPCFMTPITIIMFFIFGTFSLVALIFQFPVFMLGLLVSPVLARSQMYIQFLYPWNIARWGHFLLISFSQRSARDDDKNRGFHSRTMEQTFEVVPNRVYVHPIPQLLDNLGYLIVCLPPGKTEVKPNAKLTVHDDTEPILAVMIDCGDATATNKAIDLIKQTFYRTKTIQIQAICSTHKHHDHTGGNKAMLHHRNGKHIKHVYGGAVERVPHCTTPVANGDIITLPKNGRNDMNKVVEMEVIGVPAHTRGSVVYRLRTKSIRGQAPVEYLFTGDTMFSAGGGVPFEADIGTVTESQLDRSHGNTFVRTGYCTAAILRCFAEIVSRPFPNYYNEGDDIGDRVLIFPGHEYTSELLQRQFQTTVLESCKWKNFSPRDFFQTASQLYVALHRRSLPHNSGKLLALPSTLNREICISPYFRAMKRDAELVIRAIIFWHSNFCERKGSSSSNGDFRGHRSERTYDSSDVPPKTPSTAKRWYVDSSDVSNDVFTTVYTADLESIIHGLDSGKMEKGDAIRKLRSIQRKLDEPVVNRRPIPGFLPSDKNIFKGIAALAFLGSPPSAMCFSDSHTMNLAPPIDSNSDRILISMKRLISVLRRLKVISLHGGDGEIVQMIKLLWREAKDYLTDAGNKRKQKRNNGDVESQNFDSIELGVLKWVMYGIPANQPSWFSKCCCMPCSPFPPIRQFPCHPADKMEKKSGDLVSHDVMTCLLCMSATGCVDANSHRAMKKPPMRVQVRETISLGSDAPHNEIEIDEIASTLILREHS